MTPTSMHIENLGPIARADLEFGDLTVLVGPQATGKSIGLQMLKLLVDTQAIRRKLRTHGLDWNDLTELLNAYLGEGMGSLWRDDTVVRFDGATVGANRLLTGGTRRDEDSVFYIPAQRVMTLRDGWPRPFSDYGPADPYTVRDFSDQIRLMMEGDFARGDVLFPRPNRLKSELREMLADAVFHGFGLRIDRARPQKRLVLGQSGAETMLPFMVWSAGQREFMPLLLGLYKLLPAAKVSRRAKINWAVIEEPEMGLHPEAISAVLCLVLELLWRDYSVCVSTHSPQVLDVVWAIGVVRDNGGSPEDVLDLFGCQPTQSMKSLAQVALKKSVRVVLFQQDGTTRDISALDPASDDDAVSGWGGLTAFSGQVADVVARVVSRRHARRAS